MQWLDGERRVRESLPDERMAMDRVTDKIVQERYDLDEALGENGYPFAAIEDPELLVDHARQQGDLTMITRPNGKYNFGQVISTSPEFLSSWHTDAARSGGGTLMDNGPHACDLVRKFLGAVAGGGQPGGRYPQGSQKSPVIFPSRMILM